MKTPKLKGEYRNLRLEGGTYYFEVKTKTSGWVPLGGLTGEISREEAEAFAQNTAEGWKKK